MALPMLESQAKSGHFDNGLIVPTMGILVHDEGVIAISAAGKVESKNETGKYILGSFLDADLRLFEERLKEAIDRHETSFELHDLRRAAGNAHFSVTVISTDADGSTYCFVRDISLSSSIHSALIESRQRFKDLFDLSNTFAWEIGPDRKFAFVSPSGGFGFEPDELLGSTPEKLLYSEKDLGETIFCTSTPVFNAPDMIRAKDGNPVAVEISVMPLIMLDGGWRGARGLICDASTAASARNELAAIRHIRELAQHFEQIINDHAPDGSRALTLVENLACDLLNATRCQIIPSDRTGIEAHASIRPLTEIEHAAATALINQRKKTIRVDRHVVSVFECAAAHQSRAMLAVARPVDAAEGLAAEPTFVEMICRSIANLMGRIESSATKSQRGT